MQKVYLKLPLEDIWENRISILFTLYNYTTIKTRNTVASKRYRIFRVKLTECILRSNALNCLDRGIEHTVHLQALYNRPYYTI